MKEIETKILDLPKNIFLQKMRQIKAKKKYTVFVEVKYFDFPDGSIHARHDLLRVREFTFLPSKKKKTEVVYKIFKCVKNHCKIYEELEYFIDGPLGFKQSVKFLRQLGFEETLNYEKKRTLFIYKNWKFEFDEHPEIPPFLEIEAANAREIKRAIHMLGLEKFERTPDTISQLIKRKYPRISLKGLVFKKRGH